jgi:hypothetical protein
LADLLLLFQSPSRFFQSNSQVFLRRYTNPGVYHERTTKWIRVLTICELAYLIDVIERDFWPVIVLLHGKKPSKTPSGEELLLLQSLIRRKTEIHEIRLLHQYKSKRPKRPRSKQRYITSTPNPYIIFSIMVLETVEVEYKHTFRHVQYLVRSHFLVLTSPFLHSYP